MVQLLNNTILFYLYLLASIETSSKSLEITTITSFFLNLGGLDGNASLFLLPYLSTPVLPQKVEKNILIHFAYYILIGNDKYNTENIDYFYAKFFLKKNQLLLLG